MRTRYTQGIRRPATALLAAAATSALLGLGATPALAATTPDVGKAIGYLTAPANLIDGTHYLYSGGQYIDYGDTVNTALGLAAAGTDNPQLQKIVDYLAANADGYDGLNGGPDDFPFIGGAAKLAVLAEVVGENPRSFGGQDLITALDNSVCQAQNNDDCTGGAGAYSNIYATAGQAFGMIAQLRAGDTTGATQPIAYLESLQANDGSFPSDIPTNSDKDVDSTAMAAIALSLTSGQAAATDLGNAITFIASRQAADGGFTGTSGESINSTALALLSLNLAGSTYQTQITKGLAFLAAQQNSDGGFNVAAGQPGSNILASSQALSGALLTSFGTLSNPYGGPAPSLNVTSGPTSGTTYQFGGSIPTLSFTCSPASGAALASGLSGCSARVDDGSPQASGVALPTGVGAHTMVVTATDTDDRYAAQTITYQVAAPQTTATLTTSTTTRTTTAVPTPTPTLTHVTQSHSTWRASSKLASVSRGRPLPVGTTFGFTLNEPATVTLTFTRRLPGRKVGHLCDTPTRSNRTHPRCTITLTAKLTVHGARRGADQVKFYGQLSLHVGLGAGTYTVAITATAAGRSSSAHRLTFTVA